MDRGNAGNEKHRVRFSDGSTGGKNDKDLKAQFDAWSQNLAGAERKDLRKSLKGFIETNNTSMSQVAELLNQKKNGARSRGDSPAINEDLRKCLQELVEESQGSSGFSRWVVDDRSAPSPASSAGSPYRSKGGKMQDVALRSPGGQRRNLQSSMDRQPSAFVSMHLQRAKSALLEQLPEVDVASEEVAAWGSTEDEDFVTPWYTYVMRIIMPPLGLLIFYFIYWRYSNYPRSGIWWEDACAWIFITGEAICFLFGMTHWVWMWNLKFRKRVTQEELNLTDEDLPTVDIMIPCYSEPTEIVEMTVKACYDMDYPAHKITVYVADDGKSEDMKNMVAIVSSQYKGKMKTRYIARIKIPGVPHHAKAGNLNNIILNEGSDGQLIIILDCDMLPEPCMARTVAPFFFKKLPKRSPGDVEAGRRKAEFDLETGLLQTPQAFYNLDSEDLLGQSYAFFYECQMSGWDGTGCTPCCGTGVTFNRYAMVKVGGFSVGSITEDFKTSLNMCANGFKCKFFLQRMTRGVSPKELNAFMVQRLRWAVGAIQILLGGNPLFTKGLHYRARWLYFFSTVGICYIIPVVMMGMIMYGTILAGVAISFGPTTFQGYLLVGGTSVLLMMVLQLLAGWRLSWRDYLRALQDNFTVFRTLIQAILIGFCGMEMGFVVTSKDVSFDLWANLYHAAPHLLVYLVSGAAAIKAVCEMFANWGFFEIPWTSEYNPNLLYYSLSWTVFLWVMISGPPRMVLYGYRRAQREAKSQYKCTNANVPALQELPSTPMNTFPPLSPEIWNKESAFDNEPEMNPNKPRSGSTDSSSIDGSDGRHGAF